MADNTRHHGSIAPSGEKVRDGDPGDDLAVEHEIGVTVLGDHRGVHGSVV